jgi:uncharacterized membrane-anchored protein
VTRNLNRLREQLVFLEVADARQVGMNAGKYLAAARSVRYIVERELGILGMQAFVNAALPTLQTTAENIYFESHRRFADLDGSGNAIRAQAMADSLIGTAARVAGRFVAARARTL